MKFLQQEYGAITLRKKVLCVLFIIIAVALIFSSKANTLLSTNKKHIVSGTPTDHYYAQLPLQFEQNIGQSSSDVKYISRGSGYTLLIKPTETVLHLKNSNKDNAVIRTTFLNANQPIQFNGGKSLSNKVNYMLGKDENDWLTNVPTFTDVIAHEVYPGIDLRYHGEQRQLEYDFIIKPKGNSRDINMHFSGISSLSIGEKDQLILTTENGTIKHKKPIIYQDIDGERISIDGQYSLKDNHTVGFEIASYNPEYNLIIDPILDYSSYLGGEANDEGLSIAVDSDGNSYISGTTISTTFPTTHGYQTDISDGGDVFIVKVSPDGKSLLYTTYLGGSKYENSTDIVVDDSGNLYIVGTTYSKFDFPSINALQNTYGGGGRDGYITKLSADGNELLFSTYLGGSESDEIHGIAIGNTGNIFVTGETQSYDFPTQAPFQASIGGDTDAFISQLTNEGSNLVYSSFLGGNKHDIANAVIIDKNNKVYIVGSTKSGDDFPLSNAIQPTYGGGATDAFLAQINTDGTALNFSTYLGGNESDNALDIAIDSQENIIIVGATYSDNFPLLSPMQGSIGGLDDGFITKLSAVDNTISFSTYLGGEGHDEIAGVVTDINDNIYIVGTTSSTTGIPTSEAIQNQLSGTNSDVFVSKLSSNGNDALYSTYFGGIENDFGKDIAIDEKASVYITGLTESSNDFPILNALQPLFGGGANDAFVSKIRQNQPPIITSSPITSVFIGQAYIYDVEAADEEDDPITFSLATAPDGMTIDEISGVINWDPNNTGNFDIEVSVQDDNGGNSSQTYTLVVENNAAPTIITQAITEATIGKEYLYDIDANDPDGDTLAYKLTLSPAGMTVDNNSGLISWIPENEGEFYVSVDVTDGKSASDAQTFTILVSPPDITPPEVTLTSPSSETTVTNNSEQIISGYLNEPGTVKINGQPSNTDSTNTSFDYGPVTLVEGANSFNLTAEDTSGNITTTTLTITLDTIAPTLTPTGEASTVSNQVLQTISGNVSGADSLTINNQPITIINGSFSHDVTLLEGVNTFTLTASDFAGNTTTSTLTRILDTTPPNINVLSPQNGLVTNEPIQSISGSLNESAQLLINSTQVTVTADNQFNFAVLLAQNTNTITLAATDNAGNTSTKTLTLSLDTTAPQINVMSHDDGFLTNQSGQTLSGSLSEQASLVINGETVSVNTDKTFSHPVSLNEGDNSLTFVSTDLAGNATTSVMALTLDTTPPAATVTSHSNNMTLDKPQQLLTGSLSETATLSINNNNKVPIAQDNSFQYPIVLVEGINTFNLVTIDLMGNENTQVMNLTLDTGGSMIISVISPIQNKITNQALQTITGRLNIAGSLAINNQNVVVESDKTFSHTTDLSEGVNSYTLFAESLSGETTSETLSIILDTVAPDITVSSPLNNTTNSQLNQTIKGYLSEAALLTINNKEVTLNNSISSLNLGNEATHNTQDLNVILDRNTSSYNVSGRVAVGGENSFTSSLPLSYGENTFTIKATDNAGNSSTITRTVNRP